MHGTHWVLEFERRCADLLQVVKRHFLAFFHRCKKIPQFHIRHDGSRVAPRLCGAPFFSPGRTAHTQLPSILSMSLGLNYVHDDLLMN